MVTLGAERLIETHYAGVNTYSRVQVLHISYLFVNRQHQNSVPSSTKNSNHALVPNNDHPLPAHAPSHLPGRERDSRHDRKLMVEQAPERMINAVPLNRSRHREIWCIVYQRQYLLRSILPFLSVDWPRHPSPVSPSIASASSSATAASSASTKDDFSSS